MYTQQDVNRPRTKTNNIPFWTQSYIIVGSGYSAVHLYYFGAPVNKTGTNQKEKGGREPPACPKKLVPIVEKREDDGHRWAR